jgi:hypothetical protein
VQPSELKAPADTSCFLADDAINGLYTFAFNISNSQGFPPQCGDLSLSWPTSLESNITNGMRRGLAGREEGAWEEDDGEEGEEAGGDDPPPLIPMRGFNGPPSRRQATSAAPPIPTDISSANKTNGNTTLPPTMFGIIPLGNSFSIPITYGTDVKFADSLPPSSLSDDPTTWTGAGVTHMNWTVSLTKGTRFILVAGIGAAEEWASGGSSEMMTVGQGGFDCFRQDTPKPSVTASSSTGALNRPTAGASSPPAEKKTPVGIIVACVFSALGTLAAVTLLYCCCRVRSQRRAARKNGLPRPSLVSLATFGRLEKRSFVNRGAYAPGNRNRDTQLDLLDSDSRPGSTWSRAPGGSANSRPGTDYGSPVDVADAYAYDLPFAPYTGPAPGSPAPSSPAMEYPHGYTHVSSPSPAPEEFGRQASLDALVAYPPIPHAPARPAPTPLSPSSPLAPTPVRRGPLVLHDPSALDQEDAGTLKRDTLAALPPRGEGSRPRRRRTDDEVIVHRDAGRIRRIEELPPRYDELDWDAEVPLPRRASSVPVPSPSPRPASFAGSPSASPHPHSPHSPALSPRFAGQQYGSPLSPVHSSPARESPGLYDPPAGPYALERPISLASLESGRASPSLPPGAAPPRPPRSPMDSPRRSPLDSPLRSPLDSPHRSPLDSPVPSRHSMA